MVRSGGRGWRTSTATLAVLVLGLLVTGGLALGARQIHEDNEDRLISRRTREAAAVLSAGVPSLDSTLSMAADVVASAPATDETSFQQVIGSSVGPDGRFVSASLWQPDDPSRPIAVVGDAPVLAGRPDDEVRAALDRATEAETMSVVDLLEAERLGFALARATSPVVYLEQALPEDRFSRVQEDSAFSGLDYALYLGGDERDDAVVIASTQELPIDGRRAAEAIPFGDSSLRLVMSPTEQLAGGLGAAMPWIVLGAGAAITAAAAALTARLKGRQREAQELAEQNEQLYEEQRTLATRLQASLLPDTVPQVDGLEIGARYTPGTAGLDIGGDWYDVMHLGDRVVIVVGDVSGRGLAAAGVMASVRYAIRALAQQGDPPDAILTKLSGVDDSERQGHFATVLCGVVDLATRTVTFSNAGHPMPLLLDAEGARYLEARPGPPIGTISATYESITATVPAEATLMLVTDGLFERRGESIDVGLERLRAVVSQASGPLDTMLSTVMADLTGGEVTDDAAILALRWLN